MRTPTTRRGHKDRLQSARTAILGLAEEVRDRMSVRDVSDPLAAPVSSFDAGHAPLYLTITADTT